MQIDNMASKSREDMLEEWRRNKSKKASDGGAKGVSLDKENVVAGRKAGVCIRGFVPTLGFLRQHRRTRTPVCMDIIYSISYNFVYSRTFFNLPQQLLWCIWSSVKRTFG